jgi:hypothetical protein
VGRIDRSAPGAVRLLALLCLAGLVTAGLQAGLGDARPPAPEELHRLDLASADGDVAMFRSAGLVPGHVESRCVGVAAPGRGAATTVVVRAVDVTGALAEHLELRIDEGDAGVGCDAFTGTTVFEGTLAELALLSAAPPDLGATTSWQPVDGAERAFRVTVQVEDVPGAASLSAGATFAWSLRAGAAAASGGESATGAAPGTEVGTTFPAGPAAEGAVQPPGPSADGGPGAVTGRTDGPSFSAGPPAPQPSLAAAADGSLDRLVTNVRALLSGLADRPGLPLVPLLLVAGFLLVQHHVDRRDPKLALAPLHPETDLRFDDEHALLVQDAR